MNIGQFVADTRELTLYLLEKFGQERLVLVGHSRGAVIGALTVSAYPELYSCYVGIGLVANMAEGEAASYQWTLGQARNHQNRRVTEALVTMGPPPYQGNWQLPSRGATGRRGLMPQMAGHRTLRPLADGGRDNRTFGGPAGTSGSCSRGWPARRV